jgi:hypothetical protein
MISSRSRRSRRTRRPAGSSSGWLRLSQTGRTPSFVVEVALDRELDAATKARLVELAQDESFLLAVEEYLVRTHRFH